MARCYLIPLHFNTLSFVFLLFYSAFLFLFPFLFFFSYFLFPSFSFLVFPFYFFLFSSRFFRSLVLSFLPFFLSYNQAVLLFFCHWFSHFATDLSACFLVSVLTFRKYAKIQHSLWRFNFITSTTHPLLLQCGMKT